MKKVFFLFSLLGLIFSCQPSTNEADKSAQDQDHSHGTLPILIFEGKMELFAEADQAFAEHDVEIRAHLTFLEEYVPAQKGILYARISQDQTIPEWTALELSQPGIYVGSVNPKKSGRSAFEFRYIEDTLEVSFILENLIVYDHTEEAPEDIHSEGQTYTKEQAWKTVFELLRIQVTDFYDVIHCSGEIIRSPASQIDILSPSSGKVIFEKTNLLPGSYVNKGSVLFTISGSGVGDDNIQVRFDKVKAEYERSLLSLERKKKLVALEAVSQKDFDKAKSEFEIAKSEYENIKGQLSVSGMVVESPVSGYVQSISAHSNTYVETGSVLMSIVSESGKMIKANVPGFYSDRLEDLHSANLRINTESDVISLNAVQGKLVSIGRDLDQKGMIPVYFSLEHSFAIPGSYVELWLLSESLENQIVIPKSSIVEEYGLFYVYVQTGGETYEKREVKVAGDNGISLLISKGLLEGDIIVSKGAIGIKIANAIGAPPAHSH